MTNEQRERLYSLKREISRPKSELLSIARRIGEISPSQGEQLSKIIARLEDWQTR